MRIVHLTPGTGSFHCGSCLRDHAMARCLRARGHDVTLVPLYLPLVLDGESEGDEPLAPLFLGGINMYLQQKIPLFRHTPRWLDRLFDSKALLLGAARRTGMTRARDLGELTLSSLRGSHGQQRKELDKLLEWLREQPRPDLVSFSNGLLAGVAAAVHEGLGVPVVCSLQGEDAFLESLPEPYRTQSWEILREQAASVARFIAVSEYYAGVMRRHLGLGEDRIVSVLNGADLSPFRPGKPSDPPVIGYLARLCKGKGLDTLVDAFILLRQRRREVVRLHAAGAKTDVDEPFLREQRRKLEKAGLLGEARFSPNITLEEKVEFLSGLTLFSVPATYGEAFGLFVLEALASGVPVVQPDHGAFPEVLRRSGGGVLVRPDDPGDLAAAWDRLLDDPAERARLAREGREGVLSYFHAERMTGELLEVFRSVVPADRREAELLTSG